MENAQDLCPLCDRPLAAPIVKHHFIPPSKGGKDTPTVSLHQICQNKIVAVFSETEMKRYYNTIEHIRENEEMATFIKWVKKKEPEF